MQVVHQMRDNKQNKYYKWDYLMFLEKNMNKMLNIHFIVQKVPKTIIQVGDQIIFW